MLDYADLIARLDKLPISQVNRSIARADFIAAEANIDRIAGPRAWMKRILGTRARQRAASNATALVPA